MTLRIVPVDFRTAAEFVRVLHRHHEPPVGHKFSLGVANEEDEFCPECGGPLDPDVIHVQHDWDCDFGGGLYEGCDCPRVVVYADFAYGANR